MQQIPEAKTTSACDHRQDEKQHGPNEYHNDCGNDGCPYDLEFAERQRYSGEIGEIRLPRSFFRPLRYFQNIFTSVRFRYSHSICAPGLTTLEDGSGSLRVSTGAKDLRQTPGTAPVEHKAEHNNCRMRDPESDLEASAPTVSALKRVRAARKIHLLNRYTG